MASEGMLSKTLLSLGDRHPVADDDPGLTPIAWVHDGGCPLAEVRRWRVSKGSAGNLAAKRATQGLATVGKGGTLGEDHVSMVRLVGTRNVLGGLG